MNTILSFIFYLMHIYLSGIDVFPPVTLNRVANLNS